MVKRNIEVLPQAKKVKKLKKSEVIFTPGIREISIEELNSDASSTEENTDNEMYENIHASMEQVEYLVRANPDVRKVKYTGCGRHKERHKAIEKIQDNLKKNLEALSKFLPEDTMDEYYSEGIDILPWPVNDESYSRLFLSLR
ncbi:unnamed protein product [Blepharisma stoltei]|uniref:Uncharacterized protein n=1 Tax=Blepharisma stoltei TaxID=1481888 RepID=A0AAU9JSZ7_9CILI|nr:unnamed protein product [Blepharisma stoltei]